MLVFVNSRFFAFFSYRQAKSGDFEHPQFFFDSTKITFRKLLFLSPTLLIDLLCILSDNFFCYHFDAKNVAKQSVKLCTINAQNNKVWIGSGQSRSLVVIPQLGGRHRNWCNLNRLIISCEVGIMLLIRFFATSNFASAPNVLFTSLLSFSCRRCFHDFPMWRAKAVKNKSENFVFRPSDFGRLLR